ncbi:ubiquitin family protein [Colletotrichum tofieldiae]|uniref:Ubiquitin family protein n=1 Tax=Colletotrichum tofieldiae TaxID=708197 RepID=A0A166RSM6_9PEZI|nr:ubiquitin family protein [Colletotrichum tofieldiae]GKT64577.1 ubiquitin family protein [Colletotrichum tofieldiae]GKT74547.1 ubiquitin family protein [Colletotrichum tofieldiae]GKT91731.1 ubiquitin family protein [Colletotrichum tofieldiae]
MADNTEGTGDAQVTFKVKTGQDSNHTITMAESATVLDLKTKLAGEDFENVPVERQRLIYSGRVMKNDDTLGTYKIKPNNTIHMVKSAASNPAPQPAAAASTPAAPAVPSNMAAGTANNILAGLTGARYAGHINLPSRETFGADGGMGAPPSDDQLAQMLSDPSMLQTMNAALDNPDFINYMIQSNPHLRNVPNAREIIQSPFMRQMMTNPDMLRNVMRMQRNMAGGGGNAAFPAPGATDTTPAEAAAAGAGANANNASPFGFPGGLPGMPGFGGMEGLGDLGALFGPGSPFAPQQPGATPGAGAATGGDAQTPAGAGAAGTTGAATGEQGANATSSPPPANPFAALFAPPPYAAQGQTPGQGQGQPAANPFASPFGQINPEMMQQMMNMWGLGAGGAAAGGGSPAPPDNRPPEERYAEQLRQLNDMGFFDFDRNVAALRRSGGSVQGAIEHLLSG